MVVFVLVLLSFYGRIVLVVLSTVGVPKTVAVSPCLFFLRMEGPYILVFPSKMKGGR